LDNYYFARALKFIYCKQSLQPESISNIINNALLQAFHFYPVIFFFVVIIINIILSDSSEIRRLNKTYRNIDRITDVLSFSYLSDNDSFHGEDSLFTIGEIYICPGVAKENAKNQDADWSLDLEMILLVVHGILHIYDYDHEKEYDRVEMESLQECIVNDIRNTFGL